MKKLSLLSLVVGLSTTMFAADPPQKDIAGILSLNSSLSLGLTVVGENGIKGCVADFNGDEVDDFIITGLHNVGDPVVAKGFFRVYLGQKTGVPTIAYENLDFPIAGNGAIDCTKLSDGSFLIALQGGSCGNWTNPFKSNVYKLTAHGNSATIELTVELGDKGAGRGSILFLDVNNDSYADIFQGGWRGNADWVDQANFYINDKTDTWFDLEGYSPGTEPVRPASNNFVVKGDLNKDGKTDLVQPIQGVGLFAYFNKGDGSFKEVLVTPFPKADRTDGMNIRKEDDATQAEIIDFNGDGYPDIIMTGTNDATNPWQFILKLFKNNGNDTFTEIAQTDYAGNPITLLGGQRADIAVADFDLDGKQDVIIGLENQNTAAAWGCRTYFLKGNGNGGFEQSEITFTDTNTAGIVPMSRRGNFGRFLVGDFNGDGKKDLVTAGADYYGKNAGLRIYYNVVQSTGIGNAKAENNAAVSFNGKTVFVNGAAGNMAEVYSTTGILIQKEQLSSDDASFDINAAHGIYLVKVGSSVQKVIIR